MPTLPRIVNTLTVTDEFIDTLGRPVVGTATFLPHRSRWPVGPGPRVEPVPVEAAITEQFVTYTLDDGTTESLFVGKFTVDLPASVDADYQQEDTYTVVLTLTAQDTLQTTYDKFDVTITDDMSGTVSLRDLPRTSSSGTTAPMAAAMYLTLSSLGKPNGPAKLGADGLVRNADGTVPGVTAGGVIGVGISRIVALTQAAYDATSPKVATTLYVITG